MSQHSGTFNAGHFGTQMLTRDMDELSRATITPMKDWAQSSMNNLNFNEVEVLEILYKT